jgi:alkanesulfonate monooxygenase SsuD/methylene tetrahydromethanopterin reductase-like flavin-dependent oxidoreductase (luciferase family)
MMAILYVYVIKSAPGNYLGQGGSILEFGIQFFPSIGPDQKSAAQYWSEALQLTQLAEQLGYANVRTVEHYFHPYGGYSPDPLIFLSAAAAVTRNMRLITGAVLPVFNSPLKLAGQIGMVDAISQGRVEIGFARAFLPHEFARFGISMDESRLRFDEGVEQIGRLLEEVDVTARGRFHSFEKVTSLPRPTQKPRPPFWIAALSTRDSFENAGRLGHHLMGIPLAGAHMSELLKVYRAAWAAAGHPGRGRVMLAFHMYCADTRDKAAAVAREPLNVYLKSIVDAASDWMSGVSSKDYPNYQKMIEMISNETFESQVEKGSAWIGTPDDILRSIAAYDAEVGGFESASLQVNFGVIPEPEASRSITLFAREVMPHFKH